MPRMDPLRNTLDHLALDPAAQDDRRYLASMLRRLGYTEREIEEALGGEAARVIEVEYQPPRSGGKPGAFTVVQDDWEQDAWSAGTAHSAWPEDAPDRSSDDSQPNMVEFEERVADVRSTPPQDADWPADNWSMTPSASAQDEDDWTAPQQRSEAASIRPVAFSVTRGEAARDHAVEFGWIPVQGKQGTPAASGIVGPGAEVQEEELAWSEPPQPPESTPWPAAPEDAGAGWSDLSDGADAGWSDQSDDDEPAQESAWPAQEPAVQATTEPEEPTWIGSPDPGGEATLSKAPAWSEEAEPYESAWTDEPAGDWPLQEAAGSTWAEPEVSGEQPDATEAEVPAWAQPNLEKPAATEWAEPTEETTWDESSWETPDSGAWDAEDEAAWAEVAPQATSESENPEEYVVKDAPAGAWSPQPTEPFTYGEYTLHTRLVELGPDREQRIYFFAKGEPKSGEPCPLPEGYVVEENDRTGLPFLRREAQTSDNCLAITQAGTQCRNPSREASKYCAVHHGWRGAKALSQTS